LTNEIGVGERHSQFKGDDFKGTKAIGCLSQITASISDAFTLTSGQDSLWNKKGV
jgi:hypothetical protein